MKYSLIAAGQVVAVDAARHLGLPVWILGIWLAGATYLPLGSRDAWERKRRVAELAGARCVLVDREGSAEAVAGWGLPALDVTMLRRLPPASDTQDGQQNVPRARLWRAATRLPRFLERESARVFPPDASGLASFPSLVCFAASSSHPSFW